MAKPLGSTSPRKGWGRVAEMAASRQPAPSDCYFDVGSHVHLETINLLTPSQCAAFPKGRLIGKGSYAAAYEHATDPTKVIKFTGDPGDASTSKKLIGSFAIGSAKVFDVAKLAGQKGSAYLYSRKKGDWEEKESPIFAIVTEKLEKLPKDSVYESAIRSVGPVFRAHRAKLAKIKASEIDKKGWSLLSALYGDHDRQAVDAMEDACKQRLDRSKSPELCRPLILEAFDAAAELARETGEVPVDLHSGNWGLRGSRVVILDFGVSSENGTTEIKELAGLKRGHSRKSRSYEQKESSMRRSYRHRRSFGAIDFKSPVLWGALVAVGAIAFALRPKKAKAAELPSGSSSSASAPAAPTVPAGAETGAKKTESAGAAVTVSTDPGSGVVIAGPTGTIAAGVKRTVAKGESWSNIASRTYGDFRWWPFLWDANRMGTQFQDPSLLRVGDEITVPNKPNDEAFRKAIFIRAEADRVWELAKNKAASAGTAFKTPRPASTFAATALPSKTGLKGQVFAQSAASSVSTAPGYGGYSMPYQG